MDAGEAERAGLLSRVVSREELLPTCLEMADRIAGLSRIGVELTKKMAQAGLEASSFRAHMRNEMTAQLYVRLTTRNRDESVAARAEAAPRSFATDARGRSSSSAARSPGPVRGPGVGANSS